MLKRLLCVSGLVVLFLFSTGLTLAATDSGATNALAPNGQTVTVAPHTAQWYAFNVGLKKTPATVTLDSDRVQNVRLEIYTAAEVSTWQSGGALKAVGVGGKFPDHDLGWVGQFNFTGTYYAAVYNDSDAPANVQVTATGDGVTTAVSAQSTTVPAETANTAPIETTNPVPTQAPAEVVAGSCAGTPNISSFYVDDSNLVNGASTTLRWGLVGNADAVYLQTPDGTGGVETPGEQSIQPDETSTYTLLAYCQGNGATAQVTVTVSDSDNDSSSNTTAQGSINSVNLGKDANGWQVRVFYTWNGMGGDAQICATVTNGDSSACTTARANAPYAVVYLHDTDVRAVTVSLIDGSGNEIASGSS